jgi:signal recognition particle subunit SRP54
MGPLEGILGMLPGGRDALKQAGAGMPSEADLSRMEAIVLSMTARERSRPEIIKGSRRRRIAQGSGTMTADVNRLLKGFAQMQTMFKMTGGSKGGKAGKGKMGQVRMLRELRKNIKGMDPTQLGLPPG